MKKETKEKKPESKLVQYAKQLKTMEAKKDKIETQLSDLNKEIDDFNTQFVELMEKEGVQKFTVDNVGTCYIQADIYPKVTDVEQLHADLRDNGAGAMIKETVNYQSLKAYIKERLEQTNIMPKGVEVFPKAKVRIRKK
jgi:predicted nuclease with TOPRIM domain